MPIGDGVGDCLSAAAAMSAMQREEPEVRDKLAQILKLALASFGFGLMVFAQICSQKLIKSD